MRLSGPEVAYRLIAPFPIVDFLWVCPYTQGRQTCSKRFCTQVYTMDFQFARNLSAISRAQQSVADALLQVGACTDCLNREVILPVNDSDEAEQLCVCVCVKIYYYPC